MLPSSREISLHRPWVCHACRFLTTKPSTKLPRRPAKTRFAPSPTGYLHLGSLRTALFNYLVAKATGGKFILRIEDTDKKRTVDDAETRLLQDLKWAGLQWDEGPDIGGPCGPYRQSERTALYLEHAKILTRRNHAYKCFCSAERLKDIAKQRNQVGLPTACDRACLEIERQKTNRWALEGKPHVIRLKVPDVMPVFKDLIYGNVGRAFQNEKVHNPSAGIYEDPILIKSDGSPTYHLANVVDDHLMGITHVIRAAEWMPSTPKHLMMYEAFRWKPPQYVHVGLLQNDKREKLSKRNKDVGLESFKLDGIFPEALINYVALFGWSHNLGSDFINFQDLIKNFSMKFTKGNTVVEPAKLYYLQKKYARKYCEEDGNELESMVNGVSAAINDHFKTHPGPVHFEGSDLRDRVKALIKLDAHSFTTPKEFFDRHAYVFGPVYRKPYHSGPIDREKTITANHVEIINRHFHQIPLDEWNESEVSGVISKMISDMSGVESLDATSETDLAEMKKANAAVSRYLRWVVTGSLSGPGIPAVAEIIGREIFLDRLCEAEGEFLGLESQQLSFDGAPQAVSHGLA